MTQVIPGFTFPEENSTVKNSKFLREELFYKDPYLHPYRGFVAFPFFSMYSNARHCLNLPNVIEQNFETNSNKYHYSRDSSNNK